MKRWIINWSTTRPITTVLLCLAVTAVIGAGARWVYIDDDLTEMVPEDLESLLTLVEVWDQFGSSDLAFIAFGEKGADAMNPAALSALWDATRALEAEPLIRDVVSIASLNRIDGADGLLEIGSLQPAREPSAPEIDRMTGYLDRHPEIDIQVRSRNGDYLCLIIQPDMKFDAARFAAVLESVSAANLDRFHTVIGGHPYIMGTVPALIRDDVFTLMKIGVVVMILILLANLRSFAAVGMILTVLILSAVAMFGFMGWIVRFTGSSRFYFSTMNTSMPIVLLTIANSDGVHVLSRFFKEMRRNPDRTAAARKTMDALLLPIFLTSLTTAAAFSTLVATPVRSMTGYGVCTAFGIFWAWILSATILPALMVLFRWNPDSSAIVTAAPLERGAGAFGRLVVRHPVRVLLAGILIAAAISTGIVDVKTEVNIVNFFKEGSPAWESFDFFDREIAGTMNLVVRVDGDIRDPEVLRYMDSAGDFLETLPDVTTAGSIADVVREMHRLVMDDDPAFDAIPASRDKVSNLFTLYGMSGDPDDFSSLVDYEYSSAVITAMMHSVSTERTREYADLVERFLENEPPPGCEFTVTGLLVLLRDFARLVVHASLVSIFASILAILLIIRLFFRSIRWAALAAIPLVSAVVINFGLMGFFGVELSHITALLTSLIIGVGVDFAIHYSSRFRKLISTGVSRDRITEAAIDDVGYPILLDVGSNMGFAALLFSSFIPVQYAGGLMVFAMLSTSIGTLTVLASVAELMKGGLFREQRNSRAQANI